MAFTTDPENMLERQIERSIESVKELLKQHMDQMNRNLDKLATSIDGLSRSISDIDRRQAQTDTNVNNLSEKFNPIEDKIRQLDTDMATVKAKTEKSWDFKAYMAAGAMGLSVITGGGAGINALTGHETVTKPPDPVIQQSPETPITRGELLDLLRQSQQPTDETDNERGSR